MNNEALREFDVDEVKKAANKLDMSDRGSDEEYNRVLLAEFAAFAKLRRRAMLGQELMDDLMSNEELRELRARYLRGEVGVEEYVNAILNSEDGDRRRRMIMAMFEKGNGDTDDDEMILQRAFGPRQRRCWEDED